MRQPPRWLWVAGSLALATGLAAPLAAIPVVRSVVVSRGSALGLDVSIREVRPVFGAVHLRGVTIRTPRLPTAALSLAYVDIHPVLGSPLFRVEAHGGTFAVTGTLSELRRELDAFRGSAMHAESTRPRASVPVLLDGVDAVMAESAVRAHRLWGVRYERTKTGAETVSADLVRGDTGRYQIQIENGAVRFERTKGARTLQAVSANAITAILTLDAPASAPASVPGPASAPASAPGPASAPARWCNRRAKLVDALSGMLAVGSELSVSNVRFELRKAGQTLNVGPATIVVGCDGGEIRIALTSSKAESGTPVTFAARLPVTGGESEMDFSGGPISLSSLGVKEGDMGLLDLEKSAVQVGGRARLATDCRAVSWDGSSHFSGLSVQNERLSHEPVRGVDVSVSGSGEASLDGSRIALSALELTLGRARLRANGALERSEGHTRGNLHVEVPPTACADIAESVPSALAPLFSGIRAEGTVSLTGALVFDTRRLGDTHVSWDAENLCRLTQVPPNLSPERFRGPWQRTVLDENEIPLVIESGPGTPSWVSYAEVPKAVTAAVLVCEDARFFTHHGFDPKSISDSIRDDLRAGRFVRGGSTVTMQLAKNLFLAREKTVSRKLQEAVLTLLLEQSFTKEELLELYLNVVELAPGVYGIGPAAEYYFGIPAKRLSVAQSFYLVSLLPNPKHPHLAPDGTLHPMWAAYLKKLMTIGKKIGRLDDASLASGLAEEIRFGVGASSGEGEGNESNAAGEENRADPVEPPPSAEIPAEDAEGAPGP